MTKDEFIEGFVSRSAARGVKLVRTPAGFTCEDAKYGRVALSCTCGDELCSGWAMVSDDPDSIETHNALYAPRGESA